MHPWHMEDLTLSEWSQIGEDMKARDQAARQR